MPGRLPDKAWPDTLWMALLAIGLPLLGTLLMRVDGNWDLRNYHLYNVHAWLTGRAAIDIAAAQVQSWHSPLLDVPFYLIVTSGVPVRWAGAWLAVPSMVALFFILKLQQALSPAPPTRTSQALLALTAITGAAALSTLALSMNDAFVAAAILASLWLAVGAPGERDQARRWLLAGLVAGAITGLKLTAIFYCIGLACASLVTGDWREKVARTSMLAVGGLIGFLLTYGYWGWRLFSQYGNPFFPYYNNLFQSPYAPAESWTDERFRADSLADVLLAPFRLLERSQHFSEILLSDPRVLLAMACLLALAVLHWRRREPGRNRFAVLFVFVMSSFALWVVQYGIYRYAMALEMLGALALVLLLQHLPRWRHAAIGLAFLLVTADTRRPDWSRVESARPWYGVTSPGLPADSLVLHASGEPLAYLALGLPGNVPLVSVSNNLMSPTRCAGLQARAGRMIATHRGPVWLLSSKPQPSADAQAVLTQHYGLRRAGRCMAWNTSLDDAWLCPQARSGSATTACAVP